MIGRLRDLTMNPDRSFNVTITVKKDFREKFDQLKDKDLDIEIKQHREIRSKNANAYFHVLVNKIANETMESDEAVKVRLVTEYGVVDRTEDGLVLGFKLPASVSPDRIYKYTRYIETRTENGKLFKCYLVLKETHEMDTKEMARLIDGTIREAKELGIETDTPETLARYQAEWAAYEAGNRKETPRHEPSKN